MILSRFAAALLIASVALGAAGSASADDDPLEKVNRPVFAFNDSLDRWFLEPLAKGWRFVIPDPLMSSIDNISDTLLTPVSVFNSLVQGDPGRSFNALSRGMLNASLGIAGIIDIASTIGLESQREDFGQTLGVWGVPSGPYMVLPLLGPSSLRDVSGLVVDAPLLIWPLFVDSFFITASYTAGITINTRALLLDEIATAREGALDYYALARNAYLQRREALIANRNEKEDVDEDDLYYYDFEEDVEDGVGDEVR